MSDLLRIAKNGNFYLDDTLMTTHNISDVNEYLMQLSGFYTTIDEDVRIEEIIHATFGMKKFIAGFFCEEYEVIRALASSAKLDKKYKALKIYKSFKVEADDFTSDEEFLYVLPEVVFVEATEGEAGYDRLGELPVIIDDKIVLNHNEIQINLRTKFTFLDILTCLFEEMSSCIQQGTIITA